MAINIIIALYLSYTGNEYAFQFVKVQFLSAVILSPLVSVLLNFSASTLGDRRNNVVVFYNAAICIFVLLAAVLLLRLFFGEYWSEEQDVVFLCNFILLEAGVIYIRFGNIVFYKQVQNRVLSYVAGAMIITLLFKFSWLFIYFSSEDGQLKLSKSLIDSLISIQFGVIVTSFLVFLVNWWKMIPAAEKEKKLSISEHVNPLIFSGVVGLVNGLFSALLPFIEKPDDLAQKSMVISLVFYRVIMAGSAFIRVFFDASLANDADIKKNLVLEKTALISLIFLPLALGFDWPVVLASLFLAKNISMLPVQRVVFNGHQVQMLFSSIILASIGLLVIVFSMPPELILIAPCIQLLMFRLCFFKNLSGLYLYIGAIIYVVLVRI